MRIHSDTLTYGDIRRAADRAGKPVRAEVSRHGSRARARAWEVKLTGSSSRRPNPGHGGAVRNESGDYAATWDEWGMFLAALFDVDPLAIVGSSRYPVYAGAAHFHDVTGDRFETLTPAGQHGGGGHRWAWTGDGLGCASCEAVLRRTPAAPFLAVVDKLRAVSA